MDMKDRVRGGAIPALITPFKREGEVDVQALRRVVDFQLDRHVAGLFPCGTTGMGLMMSPDERKLVAEVVIQEAAGRVPVLVHTGTIDTNTSVELSKHAENAGADGVILVTPFFFQGSKDSLKLHYAAVRQAVSIPVFAYNIPRASGVNVGLDAVQELQKAGLISGIKDSSRDFLRLVDYVDLLPKDFIVFNGTEGFALAALMVGAKGTISAMMNAAPELVVGLHEAFARGDYASGLKIQSVVTEVKRMTDAEGIPSLFEILRERGVDCGYPRAPLAPLTGERREALISKWNRLTLQPGLPVRVG